MKKPALLALALLVVVGIVTILTKNKPSPSFDESTAVYRNFSGKNAYDHLVKLIGFGEKTPGSEGHAKTRQYLISQLESFGWIAVEEAFTASTPDGEIEFFNIRGRFPGTKKADVWKRGVAGLICSHYDTKQFSFDFPGANDGGSSTVALLEIARVLQEKPGMASQIELVWFDGEEAFGTNITDEDGLYGSRAYAAKIAEELNGTPKDRPEWGLLLDMIGDTDLKIRVGVNVTTPSPADQKAAESKGLAIDHTSVTERRRAIANQLSVAAKDAGYDKYFGISPSYIIDDHVPLNTIAGIPTIDIIDFDYDYWHTPGDTLDKISAESIEITGQTTILLIEKFLIR